MRVASIFLFIALIACNPKRKNNTDITPEAPVVLDTITGNKTPGMDTVASSRIYANDRFKDVTLTRSGEHTFLVKGKAQVFEASFGWVIEDGHDELQKGHQMTDAGAPEWGNFTFTVEALKENPNSTLMLILFESSPKHGSRQSELPIFLY